MLFWTYNLFLILFAPVIGAIGFYKALFQNKRALSTYFRAPKWSHTNKSLWIHAVSLGEVNTGRVFINELKKHYPEHQVYLSVMTETGFQAGCSIPNIEVFYLPLDLVFLQKRLVNSIRPEFFVYIEGDVWPSLSHELKKHGVLQYLVSGKISERSLKRLKRFKSLSQFLYGSIDKLGLQSQIMFDRFREIGIDTTKLYITGNFKLLEDKDQNLDQSTFDRLNQFLKFVPNKKVIVISCTHEGEEEIVLNEIKNIISDLNIILAPRHPQRFHHVECILKDKKLSFSKFSSPTEANNQIFLLDGTGFLKYIYSLADAVILGGSFVENVGGHNVMEPLFKGAPVIVGPYAYSQKQLVDLMLEKHAGLVSKLDDLTENLMKVLDDNTFRISALSFQKMQGDVLEKTMSLACKNHT
jgi:3-deoxy-D-manno-octulosonic-acid transferase